MATFPTARPGAGGGLSRQQQAAIQNRAHRRRYGQGRDLSRSLAVNNVDLSLDSLTSVMGIANELTMAGWVKVDALGANQALFGTDSVNSGFGCAVTTTGQALYALLDNAGAALKTYLTPAGLVQAGEWHFYAARWNGTVFTLYFDGVPIPDGSVTKSVDNAGSMADDSRIFSMGASAATVQAPLINGTFNQLMTWNTPLSSAAIKELYFQGKGRLVDARYPFGQYARPESLQHYYRPGEDPERLGLDVGQAYLGTMNLRDTAYDSGDLVPDSPLE